MQCRPEGGPSQDAQVDWRTRRSQLNRGFSSPQSVADQGRRRLLKLDLLLGPPAWLFAVAYRLGATGDGRQLYGTAGRLGATAKVAVEDALPLLLLAVLKGETA